MQMKVLCLVPGRLQLGLTLVLGMCANHMKVKAKRETLEESDRVLTCERGIQGCGWFSVPGRAHVIHWLEKQPFKPHRHTCYRAPVRPLLLRSSALPQQISPFSSFFLFSSFARLFLLLFARRQRLRPAAAAGQRLLSLIHPGPTTWVTVATPLISASGINIVLSIYFIYLFRWKKCFRNILSPSFTFYWTYKMQPNKIQVCADSHSSRSLQSKEF